MEGIGDVLPHRQNFGQVLQREGLGLWTGVHPQGRSGWAGPGQIWSIDLENVRSLGKLLCSKRSMSRPTFEYDTPSLPDDVQRGVVAGSAEQSARSALSRKSVNEGRGESALGHLRGIVMQRSTQPDVSFVPSSCPCFQGLFGMCEIQGKARSFACSQHKRKNDAPSAFQAIL